MEELDFNPNFELNQDEVVNLIGMMHHPGFKIEQRLWKSCVNKFIQDCINTPAEDKEAVLSRHIAMKVAAQLYHRYSTYVNALSSEYMSTLDTKPIDAGEGLDLGEFTYTDEEPIV